MNILEIKNFLLKQMSDQNHGIEVSETIEDLGLELSEIEIKRIESDLFSKHYVLITKPSDGSRYLHITELGRNFIKLGGYKSQEDLSLEHLVKSVYEKIGNVKTTGFIINDKTILKHILKEIKKIKGDLEKMEYTEVIKINSADSSLYSLLSKIYPKKHKFFHKEPKAIINKDVLIAICSETITELEFELIESSGSIDTSEKMQFYVNENRINELKAIKSEKFEFIKLIRLCEETNKCYSERLYFATAALVRSIIDHVPPVFNERSFDGVANNYKAEGRSKSFKESMDHLNNSMRKISDKIVHSQITKSETLPNDNQIDCKRDLDVLLEEVIRLSKIG